MVFRSVVITENVIAEVRDSDTADCTGLAVCSAECLSSKGVTLAWVG